MYRRLLVCAAKILIALLRMRGSSGSALPGLIIERMYPNFLPKTLGRVQKKIILVTGTNGKTTTTKMLVEALRGNGDIVVTNTTGSNMTRGLIAALVDAMTLFGSLRPADWFVFEMDEAYAPIFTKSLSPRVVVGLNVLRDQLDRYGEIDTTARLIQETALKSDAFIYSQVDPALARVGRAVRDENKTTASFGVARNLMKSVSNEQTLHGAGIIVDNEEPGALLESIQESGSGQRIEICIGSKNYTINIPLQGFHNALNSTAVAAVLSHLQCNLKKSLQAIEDMPIPFGRGEKLRIRGKTITVALVKNPSGFTSNLETFVRGHKSQYLLFVVNDKFADGRDVSWLWDVQFEGVIPAGTHIATSGTRGYDMALRLKHDGYEAETTTSIPRAVEEIIHGNAEEVIIIPTYTALFEVRQALSQYGKVPRIW